MSYFAHSDELPAWVGTLPEGWGSAWLKWSVTLSTERPTAEEQERLPYISNEDIASWTGKLLKEDPQPSESDGRKFHTDNVLLNKLRPYLAKVYHAEFDGVSSGELLCLRPSAQVLSRYLFYVLVSKGFIDAIDAETFGSKMPRADWEVVGHQPLPLPPLKTQRRIAQFLDEKTARIDALIEKKRMLLDRLAEKRQALITRAVTKGLNSDAPMKPSGIDWLGDIPAHWEVLYLRHVAEVILGLTYSPEDICDGKEGRLVIRASNIQGGRIVPADDVYVCSNVPSKIINRTDDIIVCSRNGSRHLIGKCAIVTNEWEGSTFGAFMTTVRSKYPHWMRWVLSSPLFEFQSGRYMSSTINQLTTSTLKSFPVPIPPPDEQQELSEHVDTRCRELHEVKTKVELSVEKLHQYRAALITAAVTGRIALEEKTLGCVNN